MTADLCGTIAGYRAHWKNGTPTCQPCRDAQAAWQRQYEIRRYVTGPMLIDSTGTARRLRALCAMGWRLSDIGDRLGVSGRNMHRPLNQAKVHRATAAKVAALYDELSMTLGPSERSRYLARHAGWPPPLAWWDENIDDPKARPVRGWRMPQVMDDAAIQRAMRGEDIHLRPVERAEAVRRMTQRGLSAAQIADRLRIDKRSVVRIRNDHRDQEAAA